jgi:hypothetical protein
VYKNHWVAESFVKIRAREALLSLRPSWCTANSSYGNEHPHKDRFSKGKTSHRTQTHKNIRAPPTQSNRYIETNITSRDVWTQIKAQ